MPSWVLITITAGAVLVLLAAIGASVLLWRHYVRRLLLRLLAKGEAVEAAAAALSETLVRLASADDTSLHEFALEPASQERRALHEVSVRAAILADELDRIPLPRSLQQLAEDLADAAHVIAEETARVSDSMTGPDTLEALGGIDLERVRGYSRKARLHLTTAAEHHGLDDTAVYGGGLYL